MISIYIGYKGGKNIVRSTELKISRKAWIGAPAAAM